ncbi:MAG: DUF1800 family protein [Oceanicaulis sp.]
MKAVLAATTMAVAMAVSGCGGGGESADGGGSSITPPPQTTPPPPPPPPPPPSGQSAFATPERTARFLSQATFGPTSDEIDRWTGEEAAEWFEDQLSRPASYLAPIHERHRTIRTDEFGPFSLASPTLAFWETAVGAPDQLRQRAAFALSQILVVSSATGDLAIYPGAMIYYQDLLIEHAFGNYRDLLEAVTYSPAMGSYLTYLGSRRADPQTGRMPDENYAREILQLFTIGVVNMDMQGRPIGPNGGDELYTNDDITGLARVFTGFELDGTDDTAAQRNRSLRRPMVINPDTHESGEKTFLGFTIPAGTSPQASVDQALDHIMAQPTVAPFVARQLIQRLVTSAPSADYVGRVAEAFDAGVYQLPNRVNVGEGRRGDLAATFAAVLFDEEARDIEAARGAPAFGKVREPILRVTHWARAFDVDETLTDYAFALYRTASSDSLAQQPYASPSVFNFYRPGYVAPGTLTGAQGLTMPELQIHTTASAPGYANFITERVIRDRDAFPVDVVEDLLDQLGANLPPEPGVNAWVGDYSGELALSDDPEALLDRLDLVLTHGALSDRTRADILAMLESQTELRGDGPEARLDRVQLAVMLVMTSPDYLVQR